MDVRALGLLRWGLLVAAGTLLACGSQTEPRSVTDAYQRDVEQWRKMRFERCDLAEKAKYPPNSYPMQNGMAALEVQLYPDGRLKDVKRTKVKGLTRSHVDCLVAVVAETPFRDMGYCRVEGVDVPEPTTCAFSYLHHVAAGPAAARAAARLGATGSERPESP